MKRTLFVIFSSLTILGLLALSVWQFERLAWKEDLIAKTEAAKTAEPVGYPIPEGTKEFRRVTLTGSYANEPVVWLNAKYYRTKLGFHALQPFVTESGDAVWVNRGWVYKENKQKVNLSAPETQSITTVLRREFKSPASFLPQNDPATDFWLWEAPEAMSAWAKSKADITVQPIILQLIEKIDETKQPIALSADFTFRNDHLEYAVTWLLLAIVCAIMLVVYLRTTK